MDAGALIRRGDSRHVITFYLERLLSPSIGGFQLAEQKDRTGNGRIRLTSFYVEDVDGNKLSAARSGMDLVFGLASSARMEIARETLMLVWRLTLPKKTGSLSLVPILQ